MTDRPTDRALSIALETLDQIGSMTKRGRASVSARSTAIFIRTQLESATTNSAEIGSKSVGQEHPDGIRCRSAKKHVERAREALAAADRLDTIIHLRAALLVMEGHVDVARKQKRDEPPNA